MALDKVTKIDRGGINTTSNYSIGAADIGNNIQLGNAGIVTALGGNFSGNVLVGGVLTYEDVTSIDAVGIITAQSDIHVGAGLSVVGISTLGKVNAGAWFASSGYSGIWHTGMSSQEYIIINGDGSGAKGDTFISAKSGGGVHIRPSNNGTPGELLVTSSLITANTDFVPASSNSYNLGRTANKWLQIHANGLNLHNAGIATMVGADINGDLDVDGHTNLDNVSIAGVVTATSFIGDGSALTGLAADKIFEGNTEAEVVDTGSDGHFKVTTEGSEKLRVTSQGQLKVTGNNTGNHMLGFGSNVGGLTIDDVGNQHTALEVQHGSNKFYNVCSSNNSNYLSSYGTGNLNFEHTGTSGSRTRLVIDSTGQVLPGGDNVQNLGSSSQRWKNIYSADLQLSNKGSQNDVDGTWGNYTIQEGESDLFLINNRSGKKYKFNLTEVN